MGIEFRKNLLGMVCLSSAFGLLLYWVMFMSILPRTMRPGALNIMPLLSGTVGAIIIVLFYLAISSLITFTRGRSRETLVLRRGEGGAATVGWAEIGSEAKTEGPKSKPKVKGRLKLGILSKRKYLKFAWIVASSALILGVIAWSGMLTPLMAVSSGSMRPSLSEGDLLLVGRVSAGEIQVGDIIAFNVPYPYQDTIQSPVIHRVIGKVSGGGEIKFKTKGDANTSEDPWEVPAENVIGKYLAKIPLLGFLLLALKSPFGIAFASILLASSLVLAKIGGEGNGAQV